ncbi:unnamed protein product [Timema podura]|uniref:Uncharacterized protein n=1 Tax=Timema podura TaxID=61482 RepID=A0ABN7NHK9_TIMPD|nr:unnamed protein product [Timema podura]
MSGGSAPVTRLATSSRPLFLALSCGVLLTPLFAKNCGSHMSGVAAFENMRSLRELKLRCLYKYVLFGAGALLLPLGYLKVTPSSTDLVTHQIQRRLGNYDIVKDLFEDVPKLLGIDSNHPPASPAPFPSQASAASRAQGEFKKPSAAHHNNHHGHHSAPRGGFVKPTDGKPPYGGRGGYPGQPVKHGVPASNDHRANGIVPPKGPPVGGSRIHQTSRSLPRLHVGQGQRDSLSGGQPELENILKVITALI